VTLPQGTPETAVDPPSANADIATMSYEQARDELTAIVARLESGQVELEESMSLWERGEALAKHCDTWLDRAQAKVTDGE
jgi:exodeoxyribonuclease VII small subunit